MDAVVQMVSSVGFPIVMCLSLFYYVKELEENHKEETKSLTDALNNNTLVLQKLCDAMEIEREE